MKIINDIRGEAYKGNQIEITDKNYVRYCGMPVEYFKKSKNIQFYSKSIYTVFGLRGIELTDIALTEKDVEELNNLLAI